mmetsp:Transcript_1494/g.3306  ORF Transcript_1494/g.3306 Transcript_1494/m.3306 type:complete len:716 (+) Transcript_1494:33-2180(+)
MAGMATMEDSNNRRRKRQQRRRHQIMISNKGVHVKMIGVGTGCLLLASCLVVIFSSSPLSSPSLITAFTFLSKTSTRNLVAHNNNHNPRPSCFVSDHQRRSLSLSSSPTTRLLLSADDDDEEEEWEEDDLLNELEDLDDFDEVEDEDDTTKILATDDEYDEDEDELDGLNVYEEEEEEEYDGVEIDAGLVEEVEYEDDIEIDEEEELEDGDVKATASSGKKKKKNAGSSDFSHMIDEDDDDPNLTNVVPLQDDPDDPEYNARKLDVEETLERRQAQVLADQEAKAQIEQLGSEPQDILSPVDMKTLQKMMKEMDFDGRDELDDFVDEVDTEDVKGRNLDITSAIEDNQSTTADEIAGLIDWNKVESKWKDFQPGDLPEDIEEEMCECIDEYLGETAYDVTKWMLYDLDFNVTNLILAAIKHNPDAPVIFHHWYPQLAAYKRYKDVQDRNFDYTFDDVANADVSELERYYEGFGYYEIPKLTPDETGAVLLTEMDDEEIKMAAFEAWIKDVYNEELDKKWEQNEEELEEEENIFSKSYVPPDPPDTPTWKEIQDDLTEWNHYWEEEIEERGNEEAREYRDYMGKNHNYTLDPNNDIFEKEFSGHMIIACGNFEDDLDLAETITTRFEEELGPYKVYVETRIMSHARQDDNVFEVWLEGFEVDLLHSRRRATMQAKGWNGPIEVDDKQLDWLVNRVKWLVSDEARFSEPVREPEFEL